MGRGWYMLGAMMIGLIVILVAFAAFMTYENSQAECAPGAAACGAAPPE